MHGSVELVADLKLTLFEQSTRDNFVSGRTTDYSSRDQDGTGRTQGGYVIGATDPLMLAGEFAPWSPLVWKSHKLKQGCTSTELGAGHLEGHVHGRHCSVLWRSVWKTGTRTFSGSQPSASSTTRACLTS